MSCHSNFHLILTEPFDMNNMEKVLQSISIGLIVACFLLNTNRVLKSIEICRECLIFLRQKVGVLDDKLAKSLYKRVSLILSNAYCAINDNTNPIKHSRGSGEKLLEFGQSVALANAYFCE